MVSAYLAMVVMVATISKGGEEDLGCYAPNNININKFDWATIVIEDRSAELLGKKDTSSYATSRSNMQVIRSALYIGVRTYGIDVSVMYISCCVHTNDALNDCYAAY